MELRLHDHYQVGREFRTSALIVFVTLSACGVTLAYAGEPPLQVAVSEIELLDVPEEQQPISEVLNDILAQAIEQSLAKERGYYVWVTRTNILGGQEELAGRVDDLRQEGLRFVVLPSLSFSDLGYVLRIQTYDLEADWDTPPVGAVGLDVAVMSPEANFEEIETKIHEVSRRITYRMSGQASPKSKILLWCIGPDDLEDPGLVTFSRRVTLDLPYYLAANDLMVEEYAVGGLNPRDFYSDCWTRELTEKSTQDDRINLKKHDFVISGESHRLKREEAIQIWLMVDSPASRTTVPLTKIAMPIDFNESHLTKAAQVIAQSLKEIIDRGELRPIQRN